MKGLYKFIAGILLSSILLNADVIAQERPVVTTSPNYPLSSLTEAIALERATVHKFSPQRKKKTIVVKQNQLESLIDKDILAPSKSKASNETVQSLQGNAVGIIHKSFAGMRNRDNRAVLGWISDPPDTNGEVGRNHYFQMVNRITTIFDKHGNVLGGGGFPNRTFWNGMPGQCGSYYGFDPIVAYDEKEDRWVVAQATAVSSPSTLCIAVSQTGDPLGGYNRYEYVHDTGDIFFIDFPKIAITTESILATMNIGPHPNTSAIDKAAMYAGTPATRVLFRSSSTTPVDLDNPSSNARFIPAMYLPNPIGSSFPLPLYQISVDWSNPGAATLTELGTFHELYSSMLEVDQPNGGLKLNGVPMVSRAKIRDFGTHLSIVHASTNGVENGRSAILWYELRNTGSGWFKYQGGTYAPNDGIHRTSVAIAINAAGDIGLGYIMVGTNTYMSIGLTGQSAASSGTGVMDMREQMCAIGTGLKTDSPRMGDYGLTSVDPINDTFWHTNQYMVTTGMNWSTRICNWSIQNPPVILTENTSGGSKIEVYKGLKGSQSFKVTTSGGTPYSVAKVVLHLSRDSVAPNQPLLVSLSTGRNTGALSTVSIPAAEITNSSAGSSFIQKEVVFPAPVGGLVSGTTYYLNFETTTTNGKKYFLSLSNTNTYTGGTYFKGSSNTMKDIRFQVWGNTASPLTASAQVSSTDASSKSSDMPEGFVLEQNYPNPFNPETTIGYQLKTSARVRVTVYDLMGRVVRVLVDQPQAAGSFTAHWDATSSTGTPVASGVYFYGIEVVSAEGTFTQMKKMVLAK